MSRPQRRCSTPGCSRPHLARGLCRSCYHHARVTGELDDHERQNAVWDDVVHYLRLLGPFTVAEAAVALEVTPASVRGWVQRLGLRPVDRRLVESRWCWVYRLPRRAA